MGIACSENGKRLAIGTKLQIMQFRDMPEVARRLEPPGAHDACYLPRSTHVTGDIEIHEMAFGGDDELWLVNTRFSCLATLDGECSFVPRWRPSFITELDPTDRCHLNGLAMVDGEPRYVTALGATNTAGGWRADLSQGGVLIDVASNQIVCRGLSMPHSPRWHAGRLWLCESRTGTLGTVDLANGRYEPVAFLPGFTRGMDIVGDLAFVGISQIRPSAYFGGIPILERLSPSQLMCGVCVVDLRRGTTIALLQFKTAIAEIFAVTVVPRRYPDLINEDETILKESFVIPNHMLRQIAASVRAPAPEQSFIRGPSGEPAATVSQLVSSQG